MRFFFPAAAPAFPSLPDELFLGVPWRRVVGEAQVHGLGCRESIRCLAGEQRE
jgi:hypothetical protein